MKALLVAGILAAMSIISAGASAQDSRTTETVLFTTSDGIVTIDNERIMVRNYIFTTPLKVKRGVMRLSDSHTGATAILDARDENAIFLVIMEAGRRMQIVVDRNNIMVKQSNSSESASPLSAKLLKPSSAGPLLSMILR